MQPLRRNRDFVLLQTGQALSSLGSEMSAVAYPLLTLALTHSAAKAGVVGFAARLPYTLFVLPAGVLVDRLNRKHVMIVADAGRAFALSSLVVAYAGGFLGYTQVAVVAFLEGTFDPFFNIAETGAIGQVVSRPQLPEAMARDAARRFSAVLAGPPLGGFLFGIARVLPFACDCVSYVFSVASVAAMRTPFQEARAEPPGRLRAELARGFRFLWRRRSSGASRCGRS